MSATATFCNASKSLPPLVHWRASAAAPFIPLFAPQSPSFLEDEEYADLELSEMKMTPPPLSPPPHKMPLYIVTLDVGAYSDAMGVYSTLNRAKAQARIMQETYPGTTCSIRVMPLNVVGDVAGEFVDVE